MFLVYSTAFVSSSWLLLCGCKEVEKVELRCPKDKNERQRERGST
jgi:hypothetical protein